MFGDFLNLEETAYAFETTINELGEDITFFLDDGEEVKAKMCLDVAVAKTSSSTSREFFFTGVMSFADRMSMELLKGKYFKRDIFLDKTYILTSTTENPFSSKYADVEVVECNDTIDIGYLTKGMNLETLNQEEYVEVIYENVKVNVSISPKTQVETQVGGVPKSVLTIKLPSKYVVTTSNYVLKKEFTGKGDPSTGYVYGNQEYSIEDVNDTLMSTFDGKVFYGILELQAVKKI